MHITKIYCDNCGNDMTLENQYRITMIKMSKFITGFSNDKVEKEICEHCFLTTTIEKLIKKKD